MPPGQLINVPTFVQYYNIVNFLDAFPSYVHPQSSIQSGQSDQRASRNSNDNCTPSCCMLQSLYHCIVVWRPMCLIKKINRVDGEGKGGTWQEDIWL